MLEESENLEADWSEDEDVPNEVHNKLLDAVSQLYRKKKIEAPTRREPCPKVSEFHLSTGSEVQDVVKVNDLVKVLNDKVTHKEISKNVKSVLSKSSTLKKPLEKIHADRISRKLGYAAVKAQLSRWNALVLRNRAADQLIFPLEDKTVQMKVDESKTPFKEPTELEVKMAEILGKSDAAQKDMETERELKSLNLPLNELIERRKMIAKMRARESYRISKAIRQNKIKSKKYHRILKRDKIKQELKDFEALQKTNPEAALEKLERIERARAEERMSLRHRNTGRWARSRAIVAKYDTEARAQLAEQLAKSRQLTQKVRQDTDSEEEEEVTVSQGDSNNPWVKKTESEIDSFLSGYRKFWEDACAKQTKEANGTQEESNGHEDEARTQQAEDHGSEDEARTQQEDHGSEDEARTQQEEDHDSEDEVGTQQEAEDHGSGDEVTTLQEAEDQTQQEPNESEGKVSGTHEDTSEDEIIQDKTGDHKSKDEVGGTQEDTKGHKSDEVRGTQDDTKDHKSDNRQETQEDVKDHKSNDEISGTHTKDKGKKRSKKRKSLLNTSGSWLVVPEVPVSPKKKSVKRLSNWSIEDIFDGVEGEVKKTVLKKYKSIKEDLKAESFEVVPKPRKEVEEPDLTMKKKQVVSVDESLLEVCPEGVSTGQNDLKSLIDRVSAPPKLPEIDPNKFLPVKQTKIMSEVAMLEEEGDEDEKHMNLVEAFAEDDVVDQFRREKDEDAEESRPKDVDLTLPGWGHWGGCSLPLRKGRRRTRRFVVKFPEIKRKDADKKLVIINEDVDVKLKEHMVNELPYPFTSVQDYEASIRTPIGNNWVPQTVHKRLIEPSVVTKMGAIIEPMDHDQLVNVKEANYKPKPNSKKKGKKNKKKTKA